MHVTPSNFFSRILRSEALVYNSYFFSEQPFDGNYSTLDSPTNTVISHAFAYSSTLGTRGFSRVRREFSVLAEGQQIFGRRPKPRAATETGNRARKVSGTQGTAHQDGVENR